jgi:hypothetical protein
MQFEKAGASRLGENVAGIKASGKAETKQKIWKKQIRLQVTFKF